jgi:hypothetical protein
MRTNRKEGRTMTNLMDEEFDRIARKEIRSQIAMAFISLEYEARLLDEQTRRRIFEKKANQLKADVTMFTDSLIELMAGKEIDKEMAPDILQDRQRNGT